MVFWPNHSLLVWIERIWKFFEFFPVINQGRAWFFSFGAVGECAKHAYAPSPTAHNAFFFQARPKRITINVPLFKKLWDIIFFCETITLWAISRDILRGPRLFYPLNCPKRSEGQFRGQSQGPLKMSLEMAHKVIVPQKKLGPKVS